MSATLRLRPPAPLRRLAAALLLPLLLAACAQPLEPAYDQKIVDNLETLTFATAALFERLKTDPGPAGLPAREDANIDLAARAATIPLLAAARPLPEGFLSRPAPRLSARHRRLRGRL